MGFTVMIGFFAAFVAIYLGAAGPAFRWKGALLLGLAAVVIGTVDTLLLARDLIRGACILPSRPAALLSASPCNFAT